MTAKWLRLLLLAAAAVAANTTPAKMCREANAGVQILGSGGPMNPQGRASTSYLLWWRGRPGVLVDLGPGSVANLARFAAFARHADVLILHTGLGPAAQDHPFAKSIGLPQSLAKLAAAAGARRVVLSHLMQFPASDPRAGDLSLADSNRLVGAVRSVYHGELSLASDLECVVLDE